MPLLLGASFKLIFGDTYLYLQNKTVHLHVISTEEPFTDNTECILSRYSKHGMKV